LSTPAHISIVGTTVSDAKALTAPGWSNADRNHPIFINLELR
jgi:hypothetical protein